MSLEFDGKAWEPRPDATVTAEQFAAARAFIHEMHEQALWSPWVFLERAEEYDAAWETCGQWKSTEPDPPRKTVEELEAGLERRLADADARFKAEQAQADIDRVERAKHYDPAREQARLALLEDQGILADQIRERDELLALDPSQFPRKDPRRIQLAKVESTIAAKIKEADDLLTVIGDPETVCDAEGWLPAERRERALSRFKSDRGSRVKTLRVRVAAAQGQA